MPAYGQPSHTRDWTWIASLRRPRPAIEDSLATSRYSTIHCKPGSATKPAMRDRQIGRQTPTRQDRRYPARPERHRHREPDPSARVSRCLDGDRLDFLGLGVDTGGLVGEPAPEVGQRHPSR
jgi:hypothetical protein